MTKKKATKKKPAKKKATKKKPAKKQTKAARLAELLEQEAFTLEDLREIGDMSTVRDLAFKPGARFAKGGLAELGRVRNLQFLRFEGSKLSKADLEAFATCAKLRRLGLEGCSFPVRGLEALAYLSGLKDLWLQHTGIKDAGLSALSGLAALEWLILDDTEVSDRGLKHLVGLKRLRTLRLRNTRVSDAGLLTLAQAPKVSFSAGCFAGTRVTKAGLEAAFAARRGGAKAKGLPLSTEDREAATGIVVGFIEAMYAWEKACHQADKAGRDWGRLAGKRKALARYCTPKKRVYSDIGGSYSVPPSYSPRTEKVVEVSAKSRSRMEVLTRRGRGSQRRIYVLLRKAGEWRIDSAKDSSGGAFQPAIL